MGPPLPAAAGGILYHVLTRANGRLPIFEKPGDYEAFERVLGEAHERFPRITRHLSSLGQFEALWLKRTRHWFFIGRLLQ